MHQQPDRAAARAPLRRIEPPAEPGRPLFKARGRVTFTPAPYLFNGYFLSTKNTRDVAYFTSGFSFQQRVNVTVHDIMWLIAKRLHCDPNRWRDVDL